MTDRTKAPKGVRPLRLRAAILAALMTVAPTSIASAYNQDTHQLLVDYAWQIMVTVAAVGHNDATATQMFPNLSVSPGFSKSVQKAVDAIHTLPAKLPKPQDERCQDLDWIKLHGNTTNWQNGGDFSGMKLISVPYAIALDYESGNDCGVQYNWAPGSAYAPIIGDDHSGSVLGYWAQYPDTLLNDFRVGVKPTSVGGLSAVKEGLEAAGAVAAATVWVPMKCTLTCLKSIVTFSPSDCGDCCKQAVQAGTNAAHDVVAGLDGYVPVIGEIKSDFIVGMSHHINIPLADKEYDDISGLLAVRAGPYGVPGALETLATAVADITGATIRYDYSQAPKNYDVHNAQDGGPDSRHRNAADWEFMPFPHLPMPPVDNLAWYGESHWPGKNTNFLGYVLHAIADASVPMHVAGAFGWGHRPYEDAVSALHAQSLLGSKLLTGDREVEASRLNTIVLPRAQAYYAIISSWRAAHPAQGSEVPVRALVTAVAQKSWSIASSDPALFNDQLSVAYLSPGLDTATQLYTLKSATMQQLLDEAVAASIAYLVATGEVLQ